MSTFTSQRDLDEVELRIAAIHDKRLGQALSWQRHKAGADPAAVPGVDEGVLDDFESGRRRPDAAAVIAIMDVYGCSLDDLVPLRVPLVSADLSGQSDKEVLEHYLAAIRTWRNSGGRQLQFRQDDLAVLVAILGTDPDEIVRRLVELTGCSRKTAKRFRRMFLSGVAVASMTTLSLSGLTDTGKADTTTPRPPTDVSLSAQAARAGLADAAPAVSLAAEAPADYAFWGTTPSGAPYRWDPGRTVTVAYIPAPGAPSIDIAGAVAQLAQATGLSMEVVSAPAADITITFVPKLSGRLAGSTSEQRDTNGFIDEAAVVLSEQTPRTLLHEALLHELGHAVGLDHAPRPGQVMNAVLTGQEDYQAGDLAGLRALGPLADPSYAPPG